MGKVRRVATGMLLLLWCLLIAAQQPVWALELQDPLFPDAGDVFRQLLFMGDSDAVWRQLQSDELAAPITDIPSHSQQILQVSRPLMDRRYDGQDDVLVPREQPLYALFLVGNDARGGPSGFVLYFTVDAGGRPKTKKIQPVKALSTAEREFCWEQAGYGGDVWLLPYRDQVAVSAVNGQGERRYFLFSEDNGTGPLDLEQFNARLRAYYHPQQDQHTVPGWLGLGLVLFAILAAALAGHLWYRRRARHN